MAPGRAPVSAVRHRLARAARGRPATAQAVRARGGGAHALGERVPQVRHGLRRRRLRRVSAPQVRDGRDARRRLRPAPRVDRCPAPGSLVRIARPRWRTSWPAATGARRPTGWTGAVAHGAAWCAVDLALLDAFGRAFGLRPLEERAQELPPGLPLQRRPLRRARARARARRPEAAPVRPAPDQAEALARHLRRAGAAACAGSAARGSSSASTSTWAGRSPRRSPGSTALVAARHPLLRAAARRRRSRRAGPPVRGDRPRRDGRRELHHARVARGADRAARVHGRERADLEVRRPGGDARALPTKRSRRVSTCSSAARWESRRCSRRRSCCSRPRSGACAMRRAASAATCCARTPRRPCSSSASEADPRPTCRARASA